MIYAFAATIILLIVYGAWMTWNWVNATRKGSGFEHDLGVLSRVFEGAKTDWANRDESYKTRIGALEDEIATLKKAILAHISTVDLPDNIKRSVLFGRVPEEDGDD